MSDMGGELMVTVGKKSLLAALKNAKKVMKKKSRTMPILGFVLIETGGAGLQLTSTNLQFLIHQSLEAEVDASLREQTAPSNWNSVESLNQVNSA